MSLSGFLTEDRKEGVCQMSTQVSKLHYINCLPYPMHRGQNSKQINIAKYVSKFLIYGAKMLDKCVKSQKKNFVHCPF